MPAAPSWPARRSTISAQLQLQLGLDHGLSVDTCLQGTGLTPLCLAEAAQQIDAAQELQLVANLVAALPGIGDLGLQAGLRYPLTCYGVWGYALLSSPTMRQAAELGLRYLDLTFAFTRVHLSETGNIAQLRLDDRPLPAGVREFLVLRDAIAVTVIQRELSGAVLPLRRVQLRMAAPCEPRLFIESFGLVPEFASPENCISFDRRVLDQPLPRANPALVELCERQCQALLTTHPLRSGLAEQVRRRLLTPGRVLDISQMATELGMSGRTLRRRLDLQGTSFRQLREEVRQTLAEELLALGGLTREAIAERLGYGEVANFLHAFKRWKGVSPGQYLRQRTAQAAARGDSTLPRYQGTTVRDTTVRGAIARGTVATD